MPFYDYKCKACGHEFEEMKPMAKSKGPFKCPECGARRAARVFNPKGISIHVQHEPGSARLNRGKIRR